MTSENQSHSPKKVNAETGNITDCDCWDEERADPEMILCKVTSWGDEDILELERQLKHFRLERRRFIGLGNDEEVKTNKKSIIGFNIVRLLHFIR